MIFNLKMVGSTWNALSFIKFLLYIVYSTRYKPHTIWLINTYHLLFKALALWLIKNLAKIHNPQIYDQIPGPMSS